MAYSDLIGARNQAGSVTAGVGAAKGAGWAGLGQGVAAGIYDWVGRNHQSAMQDDAQAATSDLLKQEYGHREAETASQRVYNDTNSRANSKAITDALRGIDQPSSPSAGVSAGQVQQVGGGPNLSAMSGVTNPDLIFKVHEVGFKEAGRQREWGQEDAGDAAAVRAIDAMRGSTNTQNPIGAVAGSDVTAALRGGMGGALTGVASGISGVEQTGYDRGRDGIGDGFTERGLANAEAGTAISRDAADSNIGVDKARIGLLGAQTASEGQPALPKIADINAAMGMVTGPMREMLKQLSNSYIQRLDAIENDGMAMEPAVRARKAAQLKDLGEQIHRLMNEIRTSFKQGYGGTSVGVAIPGMPQGSFDPGSSLRPPTDEERASNPRLFHGPGFGSER